MIGDFSMTTARSGETLKFPSPAAEPLRLLFSIAITASNAPSTAAFSFFVVDTPSSAAVMLTESLEIENPFLSEPEYLRSLHA